MSESVSDKNQRQLELFELLAVTSSAPATRLRVASAIVPPIVQKKPPSPRRTNAFRARLRRDSVRVLQGIADPVRFKILKLLADGSVMSVTELASRLRAHPDTMGKHVKTLRERGLVASVQPEDSDGRMQLAQIPEEFRVQDATNKNLLDFGVCILRFD